MHADIIRFEMKPPVIFHFGASCVEVILPLSKLSRMILKFFLEMLLKMPFSSVTTCKEISVQGAKMIVSSGGI